MTIETQNGAVPAQHRPAPSTPSTPSPASENSSQNTPVEPEVRRLLDALGVGARIRRMTATGRGRPTHAVEPVERATAYVAERAAEGVNAWVSTSEFDTSGNGGAEHVIGVNALTFDLDDKCADRAAVEALVPVIEEMLGVKVRALVDSGHGLQPHFAIDDLLAHWDVSDTATRQRWQAAVRDIHRAVRQVAAERGLALDTTDGIERLHRAPGTTNTKPGQPPVSARLLAVDPDSDALTLEEIEAVARGVIDAPQPPAVVATTSSEPADDPQGVERYQRAVLEGMQVDLLALHGMTEGQRDERGRGWQKALADAAYRAGQVVAMPGGVLAETDFRDLFGAHAPRGGAVDGAYLAATWRMHYARGTQVPAVLPERRDGGQVERATTRVSPADALRAKHPLMGPSRPQRKDLFVTFIDDDGKEVITDHLLVELVARYFNHNLADGGDRRLYAYRDGVYVPDDSYVMRCAAWALGDWYSPSRNRAVSEFVSVLRRPPLPDVPDLAFINVANGMIKVDSGELLPHDPAYLSAVQLPTPYEPDATCPRFDAWLAQVLPEDTVEMFWEVLGYLLLHGNPLQVAVLLHGSGGNGKGTLLRVLHHLLGRHNVSAVTLAEITEGKFEVAGMYGRQANIAGDIDPRYLKNTAKFKAITGGDVINAQHKNAKPFEFTCWAVPIFSANELWRSADVSRGYFRRWVPIPFPNSVVDSDEPFNEADLYAEAPGILAKALPALGALLCRGRFDLSPSSRALLTAFEEQADSVLSWMGEDDWLSTHDPAATTSWSPRTKLHGRYRTWCSDNGHVALSSTKFYARLAALGYQEGGRAGTRGFYGLALLEGLAR